MKKILLSFAVLFAVLNVQAQTKSPADALRSITSAETAAADAKKAVKPATWLKLASAYVDAYSIPYDLPLGVDRQVVTINLGGVKPSSVEEVILAEEPFVKEVYDYRNLYFTPAGLLALIEVTKPVYDGDALAKALEAYTKAYSVDAKGSKTKDIVAGIRDVAFKYNELAGNLYTLGDIKGASRNFALAANSAATAPASYIDTVSVFNAGFTAWIVGDNDTALEFFKKCEEIGYYSEGDLYAKISDIYLKQDNAELAMQTLEKGFELFPESQGILVGLINLYIQRGDNPDKLFVLLDKAKQNEPNNASLYYVEGNIHNELGHTEEAEAAYYKSYEINPEYVLGLFGVGSMYYNKAVEVSEASSNEFDNAKYMKLVEEFESYLIKAIDPFETAYGVSNDPQVKAVCAEYLKNIYYRFRENPEYEGKYEKYEKIVKGEE